MLSLSLRPRPLFGVIGFSHRLRHLTAAPSELTQSKSKQSSSVVESKPRNPRGAQWEGARKQKKKKFIDFFKFYKKNPESTTRFFRHERVHKHFPDGKVFLKDCSEELSKMKDRKSVCRYYRDNKDSLTSFDLYKLLSHPGLWVGKDNKSWKVSTFLSPHLARVKSGLLTDEDFQAMYTDFLDRLEGDEGAFGRFLDENRIHGKERANFVRVLTMPCLDGSCTDHQIMTLQSTKCYLSLEEESKICSLQYRAIKVATDNIETFMQCIGSDLEPLSALLYTTEFYTCRGKCRADAPWRRLKNFEMIESQPYALQNHDLETRFASILRQLDLIPAEQFSGFTFAVAEQIRLVQVQHEYHDSERHHKPKRSRVTTFSKNMLAMIPDMVRNGLTMKSLGSFMENQRRVLVQSENRISTMNASKADFLPEYVFQCVDEEVVYDARGNNQAYASVRNRYSVRPALGLSQLMLAASFSEMTMPKFWGRVSKVTPPNLPWSAEITFSTRTRQHDRIIKELNYIASAYTKAPCSANHFLEYLEGNTENLLPVMKNEKDASARMLWSITNLCMQEESLVGLELFEKLCEQVLSNRYEMSSNENVFFFHAWTQYVLLSRRLEREMKLKLPDEFFSRMIGKLAAKSSSARKSEENEVMRTAVREVLTSTGWDHEESVSMFEIVGAEDPVIQEFCDSVVGAYEGEPRLSSLLHQIPFANKKDKIAIFIAGASEFYVNMDGSTSDTLVKKTAVLKRMIEWCGWRIIEINHHEIARWADEVESDDEAEIDAELFKMAFEHVSKSLNELGVATNELEEGGQ